MSDSLSTGVFALFFKDSAQFRQIHGSRFNETDANRSASQSGRIVDIEFLH
jgi:hypothetical protein